MSLIEYKCPKCGAPLAFSPEGGTVKCEACDSEFEAEALEALVNADALGDAAFDWGDYKKNLTGETLENMAIYNCESCGAIVESDENTVATQCPYCGNNIVISERAGGSLKPNAIIPFKIKKEDLPGIAKEFYKNKKLLPNDFFDLNKIGKVQGIYVPFWLFDADADGLMTFNGTRSRYYISGNYNVTETSHYMLEREGNMSFTKIPVDASLKMDNDIMDSIEPFDYSELTPYNGAFLAGYVADRFDSDPDNELPRADARMKQSIADHLRATTGGYSGVTMRTQALKVFNAGVNYVFLPVYTFACKYKDKEYRYAVNGQTGKMVGELPISKAKCRIYFWKTFGIVFAVLMAIVAAGYFAW